MTGTVLPISLSLCAALLLNVPAFGADQLENRSQDQSPLLEDVENPGTQVNINEDQDDVYQAVKDGKIRPFSELYDQVEADLSGRIIKVELEHDDDEWIYQLKIIHDGTIVQAEYSASTLEMRLLKGHDLKSVLKSQAPLSPPLNP